MRSVLAAGVQTDLASRDDPDTIYAGAALYVSRDGGQKWKELTGLRQHPTEPFIIGAP